MRRWQIQAWHVDEVGFEVCFRSAMHESGLLSRSVSPVGAVQSSPFQSSSEARGRQTSDQSGSGAVSGSLPLFTSTMGAAPVARHYPCAVLVLAITHTSTCQLIS